jgi:amino acid adenylation domain-containing protein
MPQTSVETFALESANITPTNFGTAELRGEQLPHFVERSVTPLFEEQVITNPEAPAVICDGHWLTYGELNARANQLARHLRALNVARESLVGICIDRSVDMAIGILGILKAGAAYLPLDPDYPSERLAFMIKDARPAVVLTKSNLVDQFDQQNRIVFLDREAADIAKNSTSNLDEPPAASDLAYVIYTSGSTGHPKGVMIEHGNLANYLHALNHQLRIAASDRYLHTASIAFSSSRRQLLLPLSRGAAVAIANADQRKDPIALFRMIKDQRVTVMDAVPSFWRNCTTILEGLDETERAELLDNRLRLMLSASEPLLAQIPQTWMARFNHPAEHVHMFGQTETAGIVCLYRISRDFNREGYVPIGSPIANTEIRILDESGQPCAIGEAGEVYIGGAGVGRGYLHRPELTAEKFVEINGSRLYRTGDWARLLGDGRIEFAGRRDHQIKLRGFRVELGEVEAALSQHPGVAECAVIARNGAKNMDQRLLAYYVRRNGAIDRNDLRRFLHARLPEYSVPATFVELKALPLSPNGKVDRLALPEPQNPRANLSTEYREPKTEVERQLVEIWSEVLGAESLGRDDNFFELGGNSLQAAQIIARVRKQFQTEIPLRALFENPTVAQLSKTLETASRGVETGPFKAGVISPRGDQGPLSSAQERLWFLNQMDPGSAAYNICRAYSIEGDCDVKNLRESFEMIVRRHETLRTNFAARDGRPIAVINPSISLPFEVIDLKSLAEAHRQTEIDRLLAREAETPFDLAQDPLLRISYLELANNQSLLLLTIHHIICDGWSLGVLWRELSGCYRALCAHQTPKLTRLSMQYGDYALRQRAQIEEGRLDNQLEHWKGRLKGATPSLNLPFDFPRPAIAGDRGAKQSILLSKQLADAIKSISRNEGVTPYITMLAAWQTLLSRYTGQTDIAVGSPVAGRDSVETESLIGLFVNTVVLRGDLSGQISFRDLLSRTREVALGAFANQELPFERLVEELQPERTLDHTPLFSVMFTLQNSPMPALEFGGLKLQPMAIDKTTAKFDLTLEVVEEADRLRLSFEYKTDLFAEKTIARMFDHFRTLLASVTAQPDAAIDSVSLLSETERRQLLHEWNETRSEFPSDKCFYELFEAQVGKTPNAIAATFQDEQLSYAELNRRANQLAHYLKRQGVGPDVLVGVCVERSLRMLVGTLGVLKAGGAYVPLDPAFPAERLAFMIADAKVPVLLTESNLTASLPPHRANIVCLDADWQTIARESEQNPQHANNDDSLAYVIYTSGSTGKPKGVQIAHRALTNFLCSMLREPGIKSNDVLLAVTTLSFDIAALELYLPLIAGACVNIASRDAAADPNQLMVALRSGVTVMQATPATWKMLIQAGWRGSERLSVFCGGEALTRELATQLLERCGSLWNLYGPTETTIWSTAGKIESPAERITIGRPIANTKIYLLDGNLNPVPVGVPGELYIGGEGLARGYLDRPALTIERFLPNPFTANPSDRIYQTGDVARYLPDGRIECLGRVDQQVKIRGFRVELGEIESLLRAHETIADAVVTAREDATGNSVLVAYVVAADEVAIDSKALREFLGAKLPAYMQPAAYVDLPTLPLTPNGKVDRRALPAPRFDQQSLNSYVAPRTQTEAALARIWAEVLRLTKVGVDDNFFEIGGHSLLATQVVARVAEMLHIQLQVRTLFECPTIARLAEAIDCRATDQGARPPDRIAPVARDEQMSLSFGQQSLWFLDSLTEDTPLYHVTRATRLRGELDVTALRRAFAALVGRHESLRTSFPIVDGQPVQVVSEKREVNLSEFDLSQRAETEREAELQDLLQQEANRKFDLAAGPLMRAALFRLAPHEHVLLVCLHHIISDDWSLGILSRDLNEFYRAIVADRAPTLPEMPIQYADYAAWQRKRFAGGSLDDQVTYWKQQLSGVPATLDLPTDRVRPATSDLRGARYTLMLPPAVHHQLIKLCRTEDVTLFMCLFAAYAALLSRMSGQQDIVVGSPVAGRNRIETENLIGYFVNSLVLRTCLDDNPTVAELLQRVRNVTLDAQANQDLPFEKLVQELQPERSLNHAPLFQTMFVLQNAATIELNLGGTAASREKFYNATSPLDLTLETRETSDGLRCVFEYRTDIFDDATIAALADRFARLLEGFIRDRKQRVGELDLLSAAERRRLLVEWNSHSLAAPDACAHQLFETQAAKTPDTIAAESAGKRMSYRELNRRANQLANYLRQQGVGPEVLVGISIERSLEMLVALLGIMKAGGGYVPLDPNYPQERLQFMIADADLRLVITTRQLAHKIPASVELLLIDDQWPKIARESAENLAVTVQPNNVAYIIYTSGSTGNPKGVAIEHRSLTNFIFAAASAYEISTRDRMLQFASLSFDLSVEEIFLTLTHGATLVLRTEDMISSPEDFIRCGEKWKLSVLDLPTAYWHELTNALADGLRLPASIRLVIIGGEKAATDRLAKWRAHAGDTARLVNTYGPTETTVAVTISDLTKAAAEASGVVPIGRPFANTRAYILDSNLLPAPTGVAGELYIGGPGVARGYLNRADLTAEKFIPDPFSADANDRLYRTGDRARYRRDGQIEFLGRIDNQIKIRGFRVELEEIEQSLRAQSAISDCVVVYEEDAQRLIAYVVAKTGETIWTAALRGSLKESLPSYMVPSMFEVIDALPVTANGKIDRRALPGPAGRAAADEPSAEPSTPIEEMIASAWREALQVDRLGVHDNFFDVGGHSLLAAKVVSLVRNQMNVDLTIVDLFQAPTISALAELLAPRVAERSARDEFEHLMREIAEMTEAEAQYLLDEELDLREQRRA